MTMTYIPQAFPCLDSSDGALAMRDPGMTLRDWFAGQALAGMLANSADNWSDHSFAAKWAYEAADAMLAERAKAEGR